MNQHSRSSSSSRRCISSIALVIITSLAVPLALGGCDFINTPTKMGQGQLYTSGDGRYDPYFDAIHKEQLAAANWGDESKAARKPIITALNLRPGTSNGSILAATKEKKGDPAVGRAVDETTSAELELARRLNVAAARLEDLEKKGDDLKRQASDDKKNAGVAKADEKKMEHKDEVRREVSAAVSAASSMQSDAKKFAKEAEELASKLKLTWSDGKDDGSTTPPPGKTEESPKKEEPLKKEDPPKKKPADIAKKPATKPSTKPPDPPEEKKPPQPPQTKPPDEVFNP